MQNDKLNTRREEQTKNGKGIQEEPSGAAPSGAFIQLLFGKQIAYALSAVARLAVADHMGATPVSVDELSEKAGARAPALYRVMRLLAAVGVFEEKRAKQFALTPMGELLKTDTPGSLRHMAILWGEEWNTRNYGRMADCLRTGVDGITLEYGKNAFELLAEKPEWAERFQCAMSNFSAAASAAILNAYDFSGIRCLADVGGGHGRLLGSILERYPTIRGFCTICRR